METIEDHDYSPDEQVTDLPDQPEHVCPNNVSVGPVTDTRVENSPSTMQAHSPGTEDHTTTRGAPTQE